MNNFSLDNNLTSTESWKILESEKNSLLIDVRTFAEWAFVGIPILETINKKLIQIEWQNFPNMEINKNFANEIIKKVPDLDTILLFICKSGGRSKSAALTMADYGYKTINIIDGFEGTSDIDGHRGNIDGWKYNKLPWRQT